MTVGHDPMRLNALLKIADVIAGTAHSAVGDNQFLQPLPHKQGSALASGLRHAEKRL